MWRIRTVSSCIVCGVFARYLHALCAAYSHGIFVHCVRLIRTVSLCIVCGLFARFFIKHVARRIPPWGGMAQFKNKV